MSEKPKPKSFEEDTSNDIGKRGEKRLQKDTGCWLTPGSGCGGTKGDGIHVGLDKSMIEKKTTTKKSIVVKKDALEKLQRQAFSANMHPVFVIEFEETRFGANCWAMVPMDRFIELLESEK